MAPIVVSLSSIWVLLVIVLGVAFLHIGIPVDKRSTAIHTLVIPLLALVAISFALYIQRIFPKIPVSIFSMLMIALTAYMSLSYALKWIPYDSKKLVFPDEPVIHAMQQLRGHGRVYSSLGAFVDTYYNLPSIEGYDPLYISRYGEFIAGADPTTDQTLTRAVVNLSRRGKYADRALDFLGVSLIFHPLSDTNQSWAYPVWEKLNRYKSVYRDADFELFRNTKALPRARLYYAWNIVPANKAVKTFYSDTFDYQHTLLLEKDPGFQSQMVGNSGIITFLTDSADTVTLSVDAPRTGMLFLADTMYPGWTAYINGKQTDIFVADYAFRGVVVPAGKSVVSFTFKGVI